MGRVKRNWVLERPVSKTKLCRLVVSYCEFLSRQTAHWLFQCCRRSRRALALFGPFEASLVAATGLERKQLELGESDPVQGTPREGSPLCSKNRKHPSRTGCRQEGENYAGIMARTASTKEQLHSRGSWLTDFPSSCLAPVQFLHRL